MKQTTFRIIVFLLFANCVVSASELPEAYAFSKACLEAKSALEEFDLDLRIEFSQVPQAAIVEAYPSSHSFDKVRKNSVLLYSFGYSSEFSNLLGRLSKIKFAAAQDIGDYSRTRVTVLGENDRVLLQFFVDQQSRSIRFNERWMQTDGTNLQAAMEMLRGVIATEWKEDRAKTSVPN